MYNYAYQFPDKQTAFNIINAWSGKSYEGMVLSNKPILSQTTDILQYGNTFQNLMLAGPFYSQRINKKVFSYYGINGLIDGVWIQKVQDRVYLRYVVQNVFQQWFYESDDTGRQSIAWGSPQSKSISFTYSHEGKTLLFNDYPLQQNVKDTNIRALFNKFVGDLPVLFDTRQWPIKYTTQLFWGPYKNKIQILVDDVFNKLNQNKQKIVYDKNQEILNYFNSIQTKQGTQVMQTNFYEQQQVQHPLLQKVRKTAQMIKNSSLGQYLQSISPYKQQPKKNPFELFLDALASFCQKIDVAIKRHLSNVQKSNQFMSTATKLTTKLDVLIQKIQIFRIDSKQKSLEEIVKTLEQIKTLMPAFYQIQIVEIINMARPLYALIKQIPQKQKQNVQQLLSSDGVQQQAQNKLQVINSQEISHIVNQQTNSLLQQQKAFFQNTQKQLALILANKIPLQSVIQIVPKKIQMISKYADRTIDLRNKIQKIKKGKKKIRKNRLRIKIKILSAKISNIQSFFQIFLETVQIKFDLPKNSFNRTIMRMKVSNVFKFNVTINNIYATSSSYALNSQQQLNQLNSFLKKSDITQIAENFKQFMNHLANNQSQAIQNMLRQSFTYNQPYVQILKKVGQGVTKNINLTQMIKSQLRRQSKTHQLLQKTAFDQSQQIKNHIDAKMAQNLNVFIKQLQQKKVGLTQQQFKKIYQTLTIVLPQSFGQIKQSQGNILGAISQIKQELKKQNQEYSIKYMQNIKKTFQLTQNQFNQVVDNTFLPVVQAKVQTFSNKISKQLEDVRINIVENINQIKELNNKNTQRILKQLGNVTFQLSKNSNKMNQIAQVINELKSQVNGQISQAIRTGNAQRLIQAQTSKNLIQTNTQSIVKAISQSNKSVKVIKKQLINQLKDTTNGIIDQQQLTNETISQLYRIMDKQKVSNEIVRKKLSKSLNITRSGFQQIAKDNQQIEYYVNQNGKRIQQMLANQMNQISIARQSQDQNMARISQQILKSMVSHLTVIYSQSNQSKAQLKQMLNRVMTNNAIFSQQTRSQINNMVSRLDFIFQNISNSNQNILNLSQFVRNKFMQAKYDTGSIMNFMQEFKMHMQRQSKSKNNNFLGLVQNIEQNHNSIINNNQRNIQKLHQSFSQQLNDFASTNKNYLQTVWKSNNQNFAKLQFQSYQRGKVVQNMRNIIKILQASFGVSISNPDQIGSKLIQIGKQYNNKQVFATKLKNIFSKLGLAYQQQTWNVALATYLQKNKVQLQGYNVNNNSYAKQIQDLKSKLKAIQQNLNIAKQQIAKLDQQNRKMQTNLQLYRRESQQSKMNNVQLKSKLQALTTNQNKQAIKQIRLGQQRVEKMLKQAHQSNVKALTAQAQMSLQKYKMQKLQQQKERINMQYLTTLAQIGKHQEIIKRIQLQSVTKTQQLISQVNISTVQKQNLKINLLKLQNSLSQAQQRQKQKQKNLIDKNMQIQKLQSKIIQIKNRMNQKQNQISKLQQYKQITSARLAEMQTQNRGYRQKQLNSQRQMATQKAKVQELNKKLIQQSKGKGVLQQVRKTNSQLSIKYNALELQKQALAGFRQKYGQQLKTIKNLQDQISNLKQKSQQYIKMKTNLQNANKKSADLQNKISQLQRLVQQMRKDYQMQTQALGKSNIQLATLKQRLSRQSQVQQQVNRLSLELKNSQVKIKQLQKLNTTINRQILLKNATQQQLVRIKQELQNEKQANLKIQNQIQNLTLEKNNIGVIKRNLQQNISQKNNNISQLQQKLRKQINNSQSNKRVIQQKMTIIRNRENQIHQLKLQMKKKQSQIGEINKAKANLTEEIQQIKRKDSQNQQNQSKTKKKIQQKVNQISKLNKRIKQLQTTIQSDKQLLQANLTQLQNYKQKQSKSEKKISDLNKTITTQKTNLNTLKEQIDGLKQRIQQLQVIQSSVNQTNLKFKEIQQQFRKKNQNQVSKNKQIQILKGRLQSKQNQYQNVFKKSNNLQSQMKNKQAQYNKRLKEIKTNFENKESQIQRKLEQLNRESNIKQKRTADQKKALQNQILQISGQITNLKVQNQAKIKQQKDILNKKIQTNRQEYLKIVQQRNELKANLDAREQQLTKIKQDLLQKQQINRKNIEQINKKKNLTPQKVRQLQKKIRDKEELHKALLLQITSLAFISNQVQGQEQQKAIKLLKKATQRLNQLQRQLTKQRQQAAKLNQKIQQVQKQKDLIKSSLQARIKHNQQQIGLLQNTINETQMQQQANKNKILLHIQNTGNLQRKVLELTNQIGNLMQTIDDNNRKIEKLQRKIQQKELEIIKLKQNTDQMKRLNQQIQQSKKKISQMMAQNNQLKTQVSNQSQNSLRIQAQINRVKNLQAQYKIVLQKSKNVMTKYALILSLIDQQMNQLQEAYNQIITNQRWQNFQQAASFILQRISKLRSTQQAIISQAASAKPLQQTYQQTFFQDKDQRKNQVIKQNQEYKRQQQIYKQRKQSQMLNVNDISAIQFGQSQIINGNAQPNQSISESFLAEANQMFKINQTDTSVLVIRKAKQKQMFLKQKYQEKKREKQKKKKEQERIKKQRPVQNKKTTIQQQLDPQQLFKINQNDLSHIKILKTRQKQVFIKQREKLNMIAQQAKKKQSMLKKEFKSQLINNIQKKTLQSRVQARIDQLQINQIQPLQGMFIGSNQVDKLKRQNEKLRQEIVVANLILNKVLKLLVGCFSVLQIAQSHLLSSIKKFKEMVPNIKSPKTKKIILAVVRCYQQVIKYFQTISKVIIEPFALQKIKGNHILFQKKFYQYAQIFTEERQMHFIKQKINQYKQEPFEQNDVDFNYF